MKLANYSATLSFSNGTPSIDIPVYNGSIGPDVMDIRKLYGQTGMFTYDHRVLPVGHHLYRWRQRRIALPWLPHRAIGDQLQLFRDLPFAVVRGITQRSTQA